MAIAFDAASGTAYSLVSIGTVPHTCTGLNLLLTVGVRTNSLDPGTVTYNGVSLTKIAVGSAAAPQNASLWYLLNPATGAHDIVVKTSGAERLAFGGISLSGVRQGNQPDSVGSAVGTSAQPKKTLVSVADQSWIIAAIANNSAGNALTGTIGDQRWLGTSISNGWGQGLSFGPYGAGGGDIAGSTDSSSSAWGIAAASFAPAAIVSNLIQSAGTSALASTGPSATWLSNTTTGNMIVVGVSITNAAVLGTVTSVTDTQSNTYTRAARVAGTDAKVINNELWYATNIVGGAGSVTVNNTLDNIAIYAREYSGGYNFLDAVGSAVGSSTTPNAGTTGVPLQNNELVIVTSADENGASQTYTAAGAFGDMVGTTTTATGVSMSDNIINTGGAQTGTLTLGNTAGWASIGATFRRNANTNSTLLGTSGIVQGMGLSVKQNI